MAAERVLESVSARTAGLAELDAVTLDAYGTLLRLRDPVGHLRRALRERGVELPASTVEAAFSAEVDYYVGEHHSARGETALGDLRVRCAEVFLAHAGAALDPRGFAAAFDYEYELLPGVAETLARLAAHGLALAVVTNWDVSLHEQLRRHGLTDALAVVVTAAEVGAAKPDPLPFRVALERLGVAADRVLHVGDGDADRLGAEAAGVRFAAAPLARAVEALA